MFFLFVKYDKFNSLIFCMRIMWRTNNSNLFFINDQFAFVRVFLNTLLLRVEEIGQKQIFLNIQYLLFLENWNKILTFFFSDILFNFWMPHSPLFSFCFSGSLSLFLFHSPFSSSLSFAISNTSLLRSSSSLLPYILDSCLA